VIFSDNFVNMLVVVMLLHYMLSTYFYDRQLLL